MIMSVNDMWRTAGRPVITDLLHDQLVRRWLCDRQIVTYTVKGQPAKAMLNTWGEAMAQTAADWHPNQPYLSLHDLPLTPNLLPVVRDWLHYAESQHPRHSGRMVLVVSADMAEPLQDTLTGLTLETGVFTAYSAALAWLKAQA